MTWEPLPDRDASLRPLGSSLGRLHTTLGLARPDTVRLLEANWTSLFGPELADQCRLEALRGTELVIGVADPAVADHLRWSARDLSAAINSICGGEVVEEVTLRVRRELR